MLPPPAVGLPGYRGTAAGTVAELCEGIADCCERIRHHATAEAENAAWSPALTPESFSQTAISVTTISHSSAALLSALAERAAGNGMDRLCSEMAAAADLAEKSEVAWLAAARIWYHTDIDAKGEISLQAAETGDLVQWTNRLAGADLSWAPGSLVLRSDEPHSGNSAEPEELRQVADSLQLVSTTVTTIAAADYVQLNTAARHGRLLTPVIKRNPSQKQRRGFERATAEHVAAVLGCYRDAGVDSARLSAAITRVNAELKPSRRKKAKARAEARVADTSPTGRSPPSLRGWSATSRLRQTSLPDRLSGSWPDSALPIRRRLIADQPWTLISGTSLAMLCRRPRQAGGIRRCGSFDPSGTLI